MAIDIPGKVTDEVFVVEEEVGLAGVVERGTIVDALVEAATVVGIGENALKSEEEKICYLITEEGHKFVYRVTEKTPNPRPNIGNLIVGEKPRQRTHVGKLATRIKWE